MKTLKFLSLMFIAFVLSWDARETMVNLKDNRKANRK